MLMLTVRVCGGQAMDELGKLLDSISTIVGLCLAAAMLYAIVFIIH